MIINECFAPKFSIILQKYLTIVLFFNTLAAIYIYKPLVGILTMTDSRDNSFSIL